MLARDRIVIPEQDKDFFILLRAGLWNEVVEPLSDNPDWGFIYLQAVLQAVLGVVSEGFAHIKATYPDTKIRESLANQLIADTTTIVRGNIEMKQLQSDLVKLFDENQITALVIKGFGLSQNYPNPNVRASGDIDFLLPKEDYKKAKELLTPMASHISAEYKKNMHWSATINDTQVELHGTALSFFKRKADRMLLRMQSDMFAMEDSVEKSVDGGNTTFKTPGYEMDIYYTFFHILKHLAQGLGVRQICDLAMMLKAYEGNYDRASLERNLKKMGLVKYWKIMMSFCVDVLGMPVAYAPLFDSSYAKYDGIIWTHIKKNGNFGSIQNIRFEGSGKWATLMRKTKDILAFSPISKLLAARRLWGMYLELAKTIPVRICNCSK